MAEPMVTFRVPPVALFPLPAALAVAGLGLLGLAAEHHSAPVGSAGFYLVFLSVAILALTFLLRVQLSPAGVRIRAMGRNRLIGWPEVRAITAERQRRGGRQVTLWTASGPVRLPLPLGRGTWTEAAFVSGYHQIGQYWLAHRAPDQQLPAG
ncbi:hypothetical protein [Jatrophihabitans sp.]|uniref:hypothetical protein n=1 Tax=Jatrophihabitans sp. TaxID=1932789 RepID=UPI002C481653|nr:hypothetical protein [Jatrophihabitans sp.]